MAAGKTPYQPTATKPVKRNTNGAVEESISSSAIRMQVVSPMIASVFSLELRRSAVSPQKILPTKPNALPIDKAKKLFVDETNPNSISDGKLPAQSFGRLQSTFQRSVAELKMGLTIPLTAQCVRTVRLFHSLWGR